MKSSKKYLESALWFYVGLVFVGILTYTVELLQFVFRDGPGPEGANLSLLPALFAAMAIPYYGVFLVAQLALAKVCKPVLDRSYFLPVSLSAGAVVSFVFAGELDFSFWIFYHQTPAMGTIFLSALIVEVLFLLLNFAIVSRMELTDSGSRRASSLALVLIFASLMLLVMSWPLFYDKEFSRHHGSGAENVHLRRNPLRDPVRGLALVNGGRVAGGRVESYCTGLASRMSGVSRIPGGVESRAGSIDPFTQADRDYSAPARPGRG